MQKNEKRDVILVDGEDLRPLFEPIDIHIGITPAPFVELSEDRKEESSLEILKRVTAALKPFSTVVLTWRVGIIKV